MGQGLAVDCNDGGINFGAVVTTNFDSHFYLLKFARLGLAAYSKTPAWQGQRNQAIENPAASILAATSGAVDFRTLMEMQPGPKRRANSALPFSLAATIVTSVEEKSKGVTWKSCILLLLVCLRCKNHKATKIALQAILQDIFLAANPGFFAEQPDNRIVN
jgi:hypothetical protein